MFGRDEPLTKLNFVKPTEEENEILQKNLSKAIKENSKNLWMILIVSGLICLGLPVNVIKGMIEGTSTVQGILFAIGLIAICVFSIWFIIAKKMPQTKEVIKLFKNGQYTVHHATPTQIVAKNFGEGTVTQEGRIVFLDEHEKRAELSVRYLTKQLKEYSKRGIDGALIVNIEGAKTLYGFLNFGKKSFFY